MVDAVDRPDFAAMRDNLIDLAYAENAQRDALTKVRALGDLATEHQLFATHAIFEATQNVRAYCEQDDVSRETIISVLTDFAMMVGGNQSRGLNEALALNPKLVPGSFVYGYTESTTVKSLHSVAAAPDESTPVVTPYLIPPQKEVDTTTLELGYKVLVKDGSQPAGVKVIQIDRQAHVGDKDEIAKALPKERDLKLSHDYEYIYSVAQTVKLLGSPDDARYLSNMAVTKALEVFNSSREESGILSFIKQASPESYQKLYDTIAERFATRSDTFSTAIKFAESVALGSFENPMDFHHMRVAERKQLILTELSKLLERGRQLNDEFIAHLRTLEPDPNLAEPVIGDY